jgi:hypothetical protein
MRYDAGYDANDDIKLNYSWGTTEKEEEGKVQSLHLPDGHYILAENASSVVVMRQWFIRNVNRLSSVIDAHGFEPAGNPDYPNDQVFGVIYTKKLIIYMGAWNAEYLASRYLNDHYAVNSYVARDNTLRINGIHEYFKLTVINHVPWMESVTDYSVFKKGKIGKLFGIDVFCNEITRK